MCKSVIRVNLRVKISTPNPLTMVHGKGVNIGVGVRVHRFAGV